MKPKTSTKVKEPKTSAQLKKDLDAVVSKYVRILNSNEQGMVACYTCGKVKHFSDMHAGHFIPRNILITRWDLNNLRPQCVGCNMFGNGKPLDFEDGLVKELGRKRVDEMKASRFKTLKVGTAWYLEMIKDFEGRLETVRRKLE